MWTFFPSINDFCNQVSFMPREIPSTFTHHRCTRFWRRQHDTGEKIFVTRLNGSLCFPSCWNIVLLPPPPPLRTLPVVYSRLPLASYLVSPDTPLPFNACSSLQRPRRRGIACMYWSVSIKSVCKLSRVTLFPVPGGVEKAGRRALPLFQMFSCSHSQLVSWRL